jgi:hypothetical protein
MQKKVFSSIIGSFLGSVAGLFIFGKRMETFKFRVWQTFLFGSADAE